MLSSNVDKVTVWIEAMASINIKCKRSERLACEGEDGIIPVRVTRCLV